MNKFALLPMVFCFADELVLGTETDRTMNEVLRLASEKPKKRNQPLERFS
jgi:hypothetical protein